jgi:hypothetical protein
MKGEARRTIEHYPRSAPELWERTMSRRGLIAAAGAGGALLLLPGLAEKASAGHESSGSATKRPPAVQEKHCAAVDRHSRAQLRLGAAARAYARARASLYGPGRRRSATSSAYRHIALTIVCSRLGSASEMIACPPTTSAASRPR